MLRRMRRLVLALVLAFSGCGGSPPGPTVSDRGGSGTSGSSGANANGNGGSTGGTGTPAPIVSTTNASIGPSSGPVTISGTAGGAYASSVIGAGSMCTGYMGALPSHILEVTEQANLNFLGSATSDTVLFIRTPTGEMLCDDDGGGYPNPTLTHDAAPGRYQIWYATYSPGESVAYTLTVTVMPPPRTITSAAWAGVPSYCGMSSPVYGPITVGTRVVLGEHAGWTGSDGAGGTVTNDTWWNEMMMAYVGRTATVTELPGLDPVGCPYVRVDIDTGTWGWRIRDLSPPPTP
jgi:hypothetical protein